MKCSSCCDGTLPVKNLFKIKKRRKEIMRSLGKRSKKKY
jgi:hypothetical protein